MIPSGMVTSVMALFDWQAEGPIAVTGMPSSVSGKTRVTAWPVYLVIMTVPSSCTI